MKKLLLAIAIAIVLTAVSFAAAGFMGGACHCVTPTILLFPYMGLAETLGWEFSTLPLMVLQFPIYSVVIAKVRGGKWRISAVLIILVFHAVAAVVGLKVYHH